MQTAIVTLSDLVSANRMDAGYHILAQRLAPRVLELEAILTDGQAAARLAAVPIELKKPLMPLGRGTARFSAGAIARIEKDYPHLSIAILEERRDGLAQEMRDRAAAAAAAIGALDALADPTGLMPDGFQAGWAYPLVDDMADHYRDDFDPDGRHHYAWIPAGSSPGACTIHDAWLVDEEGAIHPGYESPVPMRTSSVHLDRGIAMTVDVTQARSN